MQPVAFGRDDGIGSYAPDIGESVVGVIASIRQHVLGLAPDHQARGVRIVIGFTAADEKIQRISQRVYRDMDFGCKTALATAKRLPFAPPFAPAAQAWARTIVESINSHSISASREK